MIANFQNLAKIFKSFLLIGITLVSFSNLQASENKFCLENDGYIMPLFEVKCENNNITLSKQEFVFISKFKREIRNDKLEEFRLNAKKMEPTSTDLTDAQKAIVSKDIADKSIIEKKKQEQIAKKNEEKYKLELKKAEANKVKLNKKIAEQRKINERKRLAFQKKLKEQKLLRLAKIEEKKRIKKEKKKIKLAKIEENKRLREEQKRINLAKIKERNLLKDAENLKKQTTKNKNIVSLNKTAKEEKKTNKNLKVILLEKKIIKHQLFPTINSSEQIDLEKHSTIEIAQMKDFLKFNKNIILIIPQDFDTSDTVINEQQLMSKLVSGSRSVPNPDFNRLQMEMRRTERELRRAQAEAERGFQMSQCYSCGLITQWGGVALQSKHQKIAKNLQSNLVNLTSSYSSTPDYIEKKMYSNYNYTVQNVDAEKKAIYNIYKYYDNKYYHQQFALKESKKFKVAFNINPQDEKFESLSNKYDKQNDILNWQNSKIKEEKINIYLEKLDNKTSLTEIGSVKEIYSKIDSDYTEERPSLWDRLFSSRKNNNKKVASLTRNNNYQTLDPRFDSVVIVKTEKGLGSGFYISKDEIITNYHVIEKASNIVVEDKNKKRSSAVVIKKDLKRDLALLKTNSEGKSVSFYSGSIQQGSEVDALGHPKGRKFSISKGIISSIREENSVYSATGQANVLYIQTDAAINPGNSGGALFLKNKVVGVNTQGLSKKKTEGMNFAIHFSEVLEFLK